MPYMGTQTIHFGTSGWRGIIAEDFTFSGVRRASAAIAAHVLAQKKNPTVLVGYDTRFLSEEFARTSAAVLRAHGCRVLLCQSATPTPTIAHAIIHGKLDGGVNITASHNPASYNGLKFSGPEGGPAPVDVTKDIEKRAAVLKDEPGPHHEIEDDFESIDPRGPYFDQLSRMIRFDVLKKAKGSFVCDALHGVGAGWLDRILHENGVSATAIRTKRDVLFDGKGPDPSEENLAPLKKALLESKALAGLATDGDADRFGIVDSDGTWIPPNLILALVYDYLVDTRGWKMPAARSVATTQMVDAVASLHRQTTYQTPVGFKYIGQLIREDKIALGGEESAGLTIRGHVPEKDGILACLLVAEMTAARCVSIREQIEAMFKKLGREFHPVRENLRLTDEQKANAVKRASVDASTLLGRKVVSVDRTDGAKFVFGDGSWMLLRLSGTEPLLRLYVEADSEAATKKLLKGASDWILKD